MPTETMPLLIEAMDGSSERLAERAAALGLEAIRAGSLEDDLCLRMKPSGLVWITRWSQPKRAEEFARIYVRIAPAARVHATGQQAVVVLGEVQDAQSLVETLTEHDGTARR